MFSSPISVKGRVMKVPMVWYEIKKNLLRPSCRIVLALLLILCMYVCYQEVYGDNGVEWLTETGERLKGPAAAREMRSAQESWSGIVDRPMLENALKVLKQYEAEEKNHPEDVNYRFRHIQPVWEIRNLLNLSRKDNYEWQPYDFFIAETLTAETLPNIREQRIKQLKKYLYDDSNSASSYFSQQEKEYLLSCYENMDSTVRMGYAQGWEHAFDAGYYVIFYGSILMAFLVSGIFANEFRWKTDAVYFSTENSRKKGVIAKLSAGFLLTTAVYWSLMLFLNLMILSMLGFDGGSLSILAYPMENWKSIYNLTFQQRSLLALLDGYLIWMLFAVVAMLVSATTRSAGLAVTVPAMLILIPNFLDASGITRETSFLMGFFPDKMARAYVGNFPYILGTLFGKVMPMLYIQRLLYIFLIIMLTLISWQVFRSKQVS